MLELQLIVAVMVAMAESHAGIPPGLRCLKAAYPEHVCEVTTTELVMCNGLHLPWDDGVQKTGQERLEQPDLRDMMADLYRPGREFPTPPHWFDPGRQRVEAFFHAMYGDTAKAVGRNLVEVAWMPNSGGSTVRVTRVNGVADALKRVSDELERTLPAAMKPIAAKTAGVFNWRTVRRSKRQSPHSWATAIDIGVKWADYWGWTKPEADGSYRWRNRFPMEIVDIFERHGFIWGGKWHHFDTMHFEYRPDLLMAPCVDGASPLVAR